MLEREVVLEKLKSAYSQKWDSNKTVHCPRLKTLTKIINEFIDGYTAKIRSSYHTSSTRTGRYCIDGATRSATMLTIHGANGYIKRHNSAEAYRSNYDIVDWILNHV
jgi:ribosomal protein S17E